MAETEIKKSSKELSEKDENDETIIKCKENGREYLGIFKLNGWKTTLLIVLVSSKYADKIYIISFRLSGVGEKKL